MNKIKTLLRGMVVIMMLFALMGCGKLEDKVVGSWRLIESSEDTPRIFPTSIPSICLNQPKCRMELLSDGNIIINAGKEDYDEYGGNLDKFVIVDGKFKVVAPLGSTAISDIEMDGDYLRIVDSNGNYVIFEREK